MKVYIWDGKGSEILRVEERQPVCGQHFCDFCGDCLKCNEEDNCFDGSTHIWHIYESAEPGE